MRSSKAAQSASLLARLRHNIFLKELDKRQEISVAVIIRPPFMRRKGSALRGIEGGFTQNYAYQLVEKIQEAQCQGVEEDDTIAVNLAQLDDDFSALFADASEGNDSNQDFHVLLLPTYNGGPAENAQSLCDWLAESNKTSKLDHIRFSMFGTGNKTYAKEKFAACPLFVREKLVNLGAKEVVASENGDQSSDIDKQFSAWSDKIVSYLSTLGQ